MNAGSLALPVTRTESSGVSSVMAVQALVSVPYASLPEFPPVIRIVHRTSSFFFISTGPGFPKESPEVA